MRQLVDLEDVGDLSTYRCPTCTKCIESRRSPSNHAISLQEANEQVIIEQSVELRLDEKPAVVKLPFNKNPVEYLKQKHRISIEVVFLGLVWQNGPEWMRRDTESMPLTRLDQLVVNTFVEMK